MNKKFREILMVSVLLMWIPLGALAFLFSPLRVDVKLMIFAGASFLAMIVFFIKER